MKKRKLCIITGSRADWGLFYPLAKEIKRNRDFFILQMIATGAHLSSDFGLTYKEIEKDGFKINRKVRMLLKGDTEEMLAKSVSLGIVGLCRALKSLKPDMVFLLGDRFETFAAAVACVFLKIPIAHIHGGELTEGSIDDSLRHAITKMAYLHFVSTDAYRNRVIQMGEDPKRVFTVGALGLDNVKNTELLSKKELQRRINFEFGKRNIILTYLPSTAEDKSVSEREFRALLKSVDMLPDTKIIFTKPTADMYSKAISQLIDRYVSKHKDKAVSFKSVGRKLYLSAIKITDVVAGNSSSGIIEVPSFGIPTINIGDRQKGRVKGTSVIDVERDAESIRRAFRKAFSEDFREICKNAKNLYGDGNAARRTVDIIKKIKVIPSKKGFFDLYFINRAYNLKGGTK